MIVKYQKSPGMPVAWFGLWYEAFLHVVATNVVARPAVLRISELLVLHLFGLQFAWEPYRP